MVTQDEREFFAQTQTRPRPTAVPSPIESSWPDAIAPEAFHGLGGEMVEAISEVSEADPVATLTHLLVAFGSAVGPCPHVRVMHDRHPARLFAVLVGETAKGRKGSSWSEPRAIFTRLDEKTGLLLPAEGRADAAPWTKRVRYGGLSSGEGLIHQVRDEHWEKQPVKEKGRVVEYQQVLVDEGVLDKRLFVIEEEFANLLSVAKRDGNNISAVIRQAWDHGNLMPMTKTTRIAATDAHISLVGHITRDELRARIDDVSLANGLANRFLWFAVRRAKLLPWGGGLTDAHIDYFADELGNAIRAAVGLGEIRLDADAADMWEHLYPQLAEPQPGLLGAVLARSEPQVLRLSLTYALLDRSDVIRPSHMEAAVAVWDYASASARWIFGEMTGDPVMDTLTSALRQSGDAGLDGTAIRDLFGRHQPGNRIQGALDRLIARGQITVLQERTGGKPRTVYTWRAP